MERDCSNPAVIASFLANYAAVAQGSTGIISEESISPIEMLNNVDDIKKNLVPDLMLLNRAVHLKLNGGLGTSMGLDKAKSLLNVKDNKTFLEIIVDQHARLIATTHTNPLLMFMNSFSTSADTLEALQSRPELDFQRHRIELMQSKVPKVEVSSLRPAEWPVNRALELCPPGHGDVYPSLLGTGILDRLMSDGFLYLFISNSDNLGATLDPHILTYFASQDMAFMMECCERSEADKKGGHLAVRKFDGRFVLRESAQCAKTDETMFQDVSRHKFFNCNSLWIRLDRLKHLMVESGGYLPLPLIRNSKTVDPQNPSSPKVYQLETAMGAAIECFDRSTAILVPRDRFVPVKKCQDLMLLQSDAYVLNDDFRPVLSPETHGTSPLVVLDPQKHQFVKQIELATRLGLPSLKHCTRLNVTGNVLFMSSNVIVGDVVVVNRSNEFKVLYPGSHKNCTIDLTDAPGLGRLSPTTVETQPFAGQKPGTSGLRKKTAVFANGYYLHNFCQSLFNVIKEKMDVSMGSLVIGGDGRYYNDHAIQEIIKIAVANGVRRILIGKDGLLSTPAVSAVIRERLPSWQRPFGAIILTASHNPAGPDDDFGIKYNSQNGGPSSDAITNQVYENTKTITMFQSCLSLPHVAIDVIGSTQITSDDGFQSVFIDIISSTDVYVDLLKSVFDFGLIRRLISRSDFSMVYDGMNGVIGPYARRVLVQELGVSESSLINCVPLVDFGGHHADPNLTYARQLCDRMGVDERGLRIPSSGALPCFGSAADGDGDRNMILGGGFFCSPSDSLAIITAHANHVIPYFYQQGGIMAVARSLPTSCAVDLVAKYMNISLFETPTGWKYFGNLMDSCMLGKTNYCPLICGEESFGTGSDHLREKDGLWATLAWLSILSYYNNHSSQFVHVEDIVKSHWAKFGRNYYRRHDFEGLDVTVAEEVMTNVRHAITSNITVGTSFVGGLYVVGSADEFCYRDPIDGSLAANQGLRIAFTDGSRVVFRLSGTSGSGATVRIYLERFVGVDGNLNMDVNETLSGLLTIALEVCQIRELSGMQVATVIT